MSTINVTNLSGRGGATPNLPDGANVTGVVTATSFDGSLKTTGTPTLGLGVTINSSGINVSGVLTATSYSGDGSGLTGVGETIAPWYYNPDVSQVDAYVDTGIGITFNKKILVGAGGSMTLRLVGAAGTVVQNWGISSITVPDATSFNASLVSDLENNTTYHLTVDSGFIVDNSGTSYVGTAYTFDTSDTSSSMFSWGDGSVGWLGHNSTTKFSSPVQIPGGLWTSLQNSGESRTSMAGRSDKTLWIWGEADGGALGLNDIISRSSPTQIPGSWSTSSSSRDSSSSGALAIKDDGTLWAWGNNTNAQLGQNQTPTSARVSSPVQIPGTTWSFVSCSANQAGAIKTDGTMWMWGANAYGSLGVNDRANRSSPIQIPGTTWRYVNSDSNAVTATKTDGTLWAWGRNAYGELGLNNRTEYSSPVQVPGTTWVVTWACSGSNDGHGVKTDGTLWSWGRNEYGQLGQNNQTNYSSPVQIPGTAWSTEISDNVGVEKSTASIKTDGTLWVWGSNDDGELGQNNVTKYSSPVQVGSISKYLQVSSSGVRGFTSLLTDTTP